MMKMALEAFLDSNCHLGAPSAGFLQSSSSDDSLEEHGQYQTGIVSLFNASTGNVPITGSRIGNVNVGVTVALDTNPIIGSYSRANSLVADSKFAFPGGPNMHRSATANMGSHYYSLSSPALFASNDFRVSGSSMENAAFTTQQTCHLTPKKPQISKKKQQQKGFTTLSRSGSQKLQNSPLCVVKPESVNLTQRQKKPRLDFREEAMPDLYISQQLRQTPDSAQFQGHNKTQLPALVQHHMHQNSNQLNVSNAVPQLNGVIIQSQQPQMRNQLQQQEVHQICKDHHVDEGVCTRRLMQYIRDQRHRLPDNNLAYWRKFVAEYFAPGAKKRWCVSLYDKGGPGAIGVAPHAHKGAWQCDMCGCRSGRGFEASFDILPRLTKLKFENGATDELLFLDFPREYRFPSGLMMLKYGKAVQESVYDKIRVVFEGQLCVVFNQDLKILSWEFCASSHEVFMPRSLVASQIIHAAQKYPNSINGRILHGAPGQGSKTNSNQIQDLARWLANSMDLQLVDDWGFSKRYTRCLQIAEIFHSMKDLMTYSQANQIGPIESLKNYCQEIAASKFQTGELQEKKRLECRDLPTDSLISAFPVGCTNVREGSNMARERFITVSEKEAALPSYNHRLGPKTSSSRLTNNFTANGISSSSRCSQNADQLTIQKILQELTNGRTVNEVEGQVLYFPYNNSKEDAATPENSFGYLPAGYDMNMSKSAASDLSSREDQI